MSPPSLSSHSLSPLVLDPAQYAAIVAAHAASTRDPHTFVRLDAELFPAATAAAATHDGVDLTKDRLMDILKWKMLRGKHRPFLPKLVASNSEPTIRSAFTAALAVLTPTPTLASIIAATLALSTPLKGVGPATASAVLATVSAGVPFMSDELLAMAGVPKPFKYSVKEYERVIAWVDERIEGFQAETAFSPALEHANWTRRSLEQALWAHSVQARTAPNAQPPSSDSAPSSPPSKAAKRKAAAAGPDAQVDSDDQSAHKRARSTTVALKEGKQAQEMALRKSSRLAKKK